jgi:flagellar hook-associated protein 2
MASIDGLITGMSTTDTISQLMKLEAAPQTALKNKITTANKVVSAYQSVNSRLSSIVSAAKALGDPDTWNSTKATASSDALVVSAQAGASVGSFSFHVDQLAATHVMTYSSGSVASPTASVVSGNNFKMKLTDGTTKTISTNQAAEKSLQSVVAAINNEPKAYYTAAAVQIGSGQYTLQLTAKGSGSAAAFTSAQAPTGLSLGTPATMAQGQDAKLTVGSGGSAYTINSATNTFANVVSGVTVTATKVQSSTDPAVTIDVKSDPDSIAAKVQALVDNANVALAEIASQSKTKTGEAAAGTLVGDSAMRKLSQDILSAVSSGVAGIGSFGAATLNDVGIAVDRSGKLTFDKEKFTTSYKADPAKTQQYFASYDDKAGGTAGKFEPGFDVAKGLARKLEAIALMASEGVVDPTNPTKAKQGVLQSLIQQRNDAIKGLNDQVSAWDIRLESRKTALQRQFSNLEVALGKMQQQSSWLAGQLAGLA